MDAQRFSTIFLYPISYLLYSHAFNLIKSLPNQPSLEKSFIIAPLDPSPNQQSQPQLQALILNKLPNRISDASISPIPRKLKQNIYERLEIGDIIYFKFKFKREPKKDQKSIDSSHKAQGIVIADFDSLVLALKNPQFHEKHAYKCFKRALFELESERKKTTGFSVAYGDPIRLRHLDSQKVLMVRPKELNKYGGLDLILMEETQEEENMDKNSKFCLLPGDKTKEKGKAAAFEEKVLIKRAKGGNLWSIPLNENQNYALTANKEEGSVFKICKYLGNGQKSEFLELKGKRIINGDVIVLRHRESRGALSLGDWPLRKALLGTKIKISGIDDKFPSSGNPIFSLNQLNTPKIIECYQEIDVFLEISPINFSHLWELQSLTPFQGKIFDYKDSFRLKNLSNGLFLAINKNSARPMLTTNPKETSDVSVEFCFEKGHSNEKLIYQGNVRLVNKQMGWLLTAKLPDQKKLIFEAKKSKEMRSFSFEVQKFDCSSGIEISDIELIAHSFSDFMDFYIFLQGFGMLEQENEQKNPSEFLLKYEYEQALRQEKELSEWVLHFMLSIESISQLLDPKTPDKLKDRQLLIKELKVFELLILLAKLIDDLVYANKNSKEHRIKATMKTGESALNTGFRFPEKSAFFIAKKHLEAVIKRIFKVLVMVIQGNSLTSKLLLENSEFFTNQLRVYTPEISLIFRTALRSVSVEVLEVNDQLMDWLGSLESINEKLWNIEDQTELINIISASLIDNHENAIRSNQQRVQMELFSHRGGSEMKKGLLRFAFQQDRPVVILKKDGALSDFLANNPSLTNIPIAKVKEKEESAAFFIEDLVGKHDFRAHIRYISSVLTLIALLIKDRNMKVITKVHSLEISSQHILFCLKAHGFPLPLKAAYWQLYESLYLDREPFNPVSKYTNRCILWADIKDFSLLNPTYHLLNLEDLKNPEKEGEKVVNEQFMEIERLLLDFWSEKGSQTTSVHQFSPQDSINENASSSFYLKEQLNFIEVMLQITRKVIDLGYTSVIFNQRAFKLLAKAFTTLVSSPSESLFWLGDILLEASNDKNLEEEFNKVLGEVCKTIMTYYQVLEIVQIHIFMRILKENFEDFTVRPNFTELFSFSLKPQTTISTVKNSQIVGNKLVGSKTLESKTMNKVAAAGETTMKSESINGNNCELDVSVFIFLLGNSKLPAGLIKKIMGVIERYFELRKGLFSEVQLIELIDGKKEEGLYKELDGTPDLFGQVISPKKLEFQIEKVLTEFDERNKGSKDLSQRENKIRELNNVINKLLSKFKETLALEKSLFLLMQNIIRNLQVHEYIFRLLSLQSPKKPQEEIELLHITIEFFQLFCLENEKNQDWVLKRLSRFLELLFHRISIFKLLVAALRGSASKTERISGYFELLFGFLKRNHQTHKKNQKSAVPFKFLALEVFTVLKAMLFDPRSGGMYLENQKKVVNLLLKHDFLLKFAKTGQYLDVRNRLLEKHRREKDMYSLMFHLTLVEMLGFLAIDFKLTVLQLRKILVFEQLKTLLYDSNTPYIFKKPYLRVVFVVYFLQSEDDSLVISSEDFTSFLSSLLGDIQAGYYFLEYLIRIKKNRGGATILSEEEIKRARQEIASNRTGFMDKPIPLGDGNEERPKAKKNTANLELVNLETKKIINDGGDYWKYFYGGSRRFTGKKDGMMRVLMDTIKEIQKRGVNTDLHVGDMMERIRKALIRLKAGITKIERVANQSLTKYQLIIHEALSLFPGKPGGKPQLIGQKQPEDTAIAQEMMHEFMEKLTGILEKKKLSIKDFERLYGFSGNKQLLTRDEFIEKTREVLGKLGPEGEMPKEELVSFVEAFLQFKRNANEVSFPRFIRKLVKTIENKRAIYQREGLKNEKLTAFRLEDAELSKQKKESLRGLIHWFEKDCLIKAQDAEIKSMVSRFTEGLKDREQIEIIELIRRMVVVFQLYGKPEFLLKGLDLFSGELRRSNKKELSEVLFSTGVVNQTLSFLKKDQDPGFLELALRVLLNCLYIDSKKTQREVLETLQDIENRGLLIETFGFLKTCLSYQENKGRGFGIGDDRLKPVVSKTIRFLALCCENCYQPFQNFLREQEFSYNATGLASSNLVVMTAELLGVLPKDELDFELVEDVIKTLMKYCLGPCERNQAVLSSNKTLFQFLNDYIYQDSFDFLSEDPGHLKKIRVFHISIKLLLSLSDANKALNHFISFLDVTQLISKMSIIYHEKISPNVKSILNGEHIGLEASFSNQIIETGFDIFILLSILKDSSPEHSKLKSFSLEKKGKLRSTKYHRAASKSQLQKKFKRNVVVPLNIKSSKTKIIPCLLEKNSQQSINENKVEPMLEDDSNTSISISEGFEEHERINKEQQELDEGLWFYKGLVGNVEVVNKGVLRKVFFPKPFLSIYLTENIHHNLLVDNQNRLLKSRLEHLLRNMARYKGEMQHFRMIGRLKALDFLVKSWRKLKDVSLILIIFIVILLLMGEDSKSLFTINTVVTVIQLVLGVFVAFFCILERFPMSMGLKYPFEDLIFGYLKKKELFPSRLHTFHFRYYLCHTIRRAYKRMESTKWRILKVFLDIENLYNLVYLSITVVAYINPYYYAIMLLDIVKRSRMLQNIIRSITENWIQLVKLAVFTVCVLYIYSFIVYESYPQRLSPSHDMYNSTLWLVFLGTVNHGLRDNGGLGDSLIHPTIYDPDYWPIWFYSLSFYIVVNLMLVKLVFWIIIDTFRELRERRAKVEKEIRTQCFICGIKKQEFELRGNGWQNHIYVEHNVFNYLEFALYIEEKDIRDCNELEKDVKEMLSRKNTGFFPINRAMVFEEKDSKNANV